MLYKDELDDVNYDHAIDTFLNIKAIDNNNAFSLLQCNTISFK